MSIPSDSMSTMKQVRPRCLGTFGSVRTMMTPHLQKWAPVFQVFCPSRIQSVPSRRARVVRPATSEPAPGSLKSWHQTSSPRAILRRWRSFCPSVPCFIRVGPSIPIPIVRDVGRRAAAKLLLRPDDLFHRSEPTPAVLGRPREASPSVVELERLPVLRAPHRVRVVADERAGRRGAGREGLGVALEEGARLGAELRFGRRVVEVHVGILLRAESADPGYSAAARSAAAPGSAASVLSLVQCRIYPFRYPQVRLVGGVTGQSGRRVHPGRRRGDRPVAPTRHWTSDTTPGGRRAGRATLPPDPRRGRGSGRGGRRGGSRAPR